MNDFFPFQGSEIFFSISSLRKIQRMEGEINIVSTVCPDYPHKNGKYTFYGELGKDIGLVARKHLDLVPAFLKKLAEKNNVKYRILVADLPELAYCQKEFVLRVANSEQDYLDRCQKSSEKIGLEVEALGFCETFSKFYGDRNINYLKIQEKTSEEILKRAREDEKLMSFLNYFSFERRRLAERFRGRRLSDEELKIVSAHGMSLYTTHGTLLKKIFENENLIVLNHSTLNLKNFFKYEFVEGYESVGKIQNFPIGIISGDFYT